MLPDFILLNSVLYMREKTLFHPILMHFAARYTGYTYREFASDYLVLVQNNLKRLYP